MAIPGISQSHVAERTAQATTVEFTQASRTRSYVIRGSSPMFYSSEQRVCVAFFRDKLGLTRQGTSAPARRVHLCQAKYAR